MKMIDDVIIIGIDSGYGNIKTANCCFPASVFTYAKEPVFKENLLVFESKFYLIGEGHKEFLADKTKDLDYYVLALAAIARELNIRKMTCGKIRIAAGLPLTWVSGQRDEFRDYLMQNKAVDFSFRNVSYHVEIVGVDVFPQGFAAVADRLSDFRGVNMICDIGNGTMNIMFINDKKPVSGNMFTEKYGTHQCLLAVRENVMRVHHTTVDEAIINRVFRFGTADIKEDYLKTITDTATDYVEGIFQRLREHEYNPELMRLYVLGGGSCLIRNFGVYDASRVTILSKSSSRKSNERRERKMSYSSGEAAEQVVRMTLNGVEVAAKISGKAAERLAVLLYAVLKDQKKTRGKTRLNSMLRSGKELKVFAIGDRDLEKFCREAKKYGILYCVLKDKTANDGHTDVFVRAEDASKINRIFDRFGIATADIGSARTEIVKAKEEQKNADIPVPDRSTTEKDKEEAFLDALLTPAPNKEEAQTQNPTQGPAAKSRPSEPTSNQREKTVRGISDPTERSRPSVRQEMKEIREEQRQRTSSAQKTKDEPNRTSEHRPVPKKKKDKER